MSPRSFMARRPLAVLFILVTFGLGTVELLSRSQSGVELPYWSPTRVISTLFRDLVRPEDVTGSMGDRNRARNLLSHWSTTIANWAIAFGAATVIGVVFGVLLGLSRPAHAILSPAVHFLRSLPSAALWAVLGVTVGFGWMPRLSLVVFGSVWPVLINTAASLRALHPEARESIEFMNLTPVRTLYIKVRWALGGVLTGLELGASVALLLTVTLEVLWRADGGVGFYLMMAYENADGAATLAGCLLIALTALAINQSLASSRSLLAAWSADGSEFLASFRRNLADWREKFSRFLGPPGKRSVARVIDPGLRELILSGQVSVDSRRLFGQNTQRKQSYNASPPYIFPDELEQLGEDVDTSTILQRDSVLLDELQRPLMFARSWVNLAAFESSVQKQIHDGLVPLGDILTSSGVTWSSTDLRFSLEISTDLGNLFERGAAVEVLRRTRFLLVKEAPAVFACEYVPLHRRSSAVVPRSES